jgi:hypothetical protein
LQAQGGSGTDIAGAGLTIQSGAGTGAGAGSTLTFKAPLATTTGTTGQTQTTLMDVGTTNGIRVYSTLQTNAVRPDSTDSRTVGTASVLYTNGFFSRATLGSKSKAITDGSATAFATATLADGATFAGEAIYSVTAVKGTDLQILSGRFRFAAARVGTNYYVSVSQVGTETVAASTGSLVPTASATGGISISGTGGVITFSANYDTSFASPDSMAINVRFDSPNSTLALTFP